jgi:hypothetical protein
MYKLSILNPVAPQQGDITALPMAERPTSLAGKTLGLLWNGKAHGDTALKRAGEQIQKRVPDLTVKFYSGALPCPEKLMERAKAEADVVIACTAD